MRSRTPQPCLPGAVAACSNRGCLLRGGTARAVGRLGVPSRPLVLQAAAAGGVPPPPSPLPATLHLPHCILPLHYRTLPCCIPLPPLPQRDLLALDD